MKWNGTECEVLCNEVEWEEHNGIEWNAMEWEVSNGMVWEENN